MDESEALVERDLKARSFTEVIYEFNGNVPPDFLADGGVAVEVGLTCPPDSHPAGTRVRGLFAPQIGRGRLHAGKRTNGVPFDVCLDRLKPYKLKVRYGPDRNFQTSERTVRLRRVMRPVRGFA